MSSYTPISDSKERLARNSRGGYFNLEADPGMRQILTRVNFIQSGLAKLAQANYLVEEEERRQSHREQLDNSYLPAGFADTYVPPVTVPVITEQEVKAFEQMSVEELTARANALAQETGARASQLNPDITV